MENDVCVDVYECIIFHTHINMDKHICILMFVFQMYIACVANPCYNINYISTFRLDFSKKMSNKRLSHMKNNKYINT